VLWIREPLLEVEESSIWSEAGRQAVEETTL